MSNFTLIGVSGAKNSGKTFFTNLVTKYLDKINIVARKFSLKDFVKYEMHDFVQSNLGISTFSGLKNDKDFISNLVEEYYDLKRAKDISYWTSLGTDMVNESNYARYIFVEDIRYKEEIFWLKNLGGKLVHITCYDEDVDKPNIELNLLRESDFRFSWPNLSIEEAQHHTEEFFNKVLWNA